MRNGIKTSAHVKTAASFIQGAGLKPAFRRMTQNGQVRNLPQPKLSARYSSFDSHLLAWCPSNSFKSLVLHDRESEPLRGAKRRSNLRRVFCNPARLLRCARNDRIGPHRLVPNVGRGSGGRLRNLFEGQDTKELVQNWSCEILPDSP
jgi:hypothetical protein